MSVDVSKGSHRRLEERVLYLRIGAKDRLMFVSTLDRCRRRCGLPNSIASQASQRG